MPSNHVLAPAKRTENYGHQEHTQGERTRASLDVKPSHFLVLPEYKRQRGPVSWAPGSVYSAWDDWATWSIAEREPLRKLVDDIGKLVADVDVLSRTTSAVVELDQADLATSADSANQP